MDASASCGWCKKAGTKRCSRCKKATYCSQICQRNHWKIHKKICKKVNINTTQQTMQHDIYHRMAQNLQKNKNKTSKSSQNQPNMNDINYEGHILPMSQHYDFLFKFIIGGGCGVGKSSLILRYIDDTFTEYCISTIGVDFKLKTIEIRNEIIKLQIWDNWGMQRFLHSEKNKYRAAHAIFLLYDITYKGSFLNLKHWIKDIKKYTKPHFPIFLIGSKCDLKHKRVVSYNTAKLFADKYDMDYMETSAKENINVDKAFILMTTKLLNPLKKWNEKLVYGYCREYMNKNHARIPIDIINLCCMWYCDIKTNKPQNVNTINMLNGQIKNINKPNWKINAIIGTAMVTVFAITCKLWSK